MAKVAFLLALLIGAVAAAAPPAPITPPNTAPDALDEEGVIVYSPAVGHVVAWTREEDSVPTAWAMRSDDDGATWTDAAPIAPAAVSDFGPSLVVDGATVHVAWSSRQPNGETYSLYAASTDGGVTWSAPQLACPSGGLRDDGGAGVVVYGGRVLIYYDTLIRSWTGTRDVLVCSSTARDADGIVTAWGMSSFVWGVNGGAGSTLRHDVAPRAYLRPDGLLALLWTRHSGDPNDPMAVLSPSVRHFVGTTAWPSSVWNGAQLVPFNGAVLPSLWWRAGVGQWATLLVGGFGLIDIPVPWDGRTYTHAGNAYGHDGYSAHVASTSQPGVYLRTFTRADTPGMPWRVWGGHFSP